MSCRRVTLLVQVRGLSSMARTLDSSLQLRCVRNDSDRGYVRVYESGSPAHRRVDSRPVSGYGVTFLRGNDG